MTVGVILSAGQGVFYSCNSIVFKHLTDALIDGEMLWLNGSFKYPAFEDKAMNAIMLYVYVGTGTFLCGFLSVSFAAVATS